MKLVKCRMWLFKVSEMLSFYKKRRQKSSFLPGSPDWLAHTLTNPRTSRGKHSKPFGCCLMHTQSNPLSQCYGYPECSDTYVYVSGVVRCKWNPHTWNSQLLWTHRVQSIFQPLGIDYPYVHSIVTSIWFNVEIIPCKSWTS